MLGSHVICHSNGGITSAIFTTVEHLRAPTLSKDQHRKGSWTAFNETTLVTPFHRGSNEIKFMFDLGCFYSCIAPSLHCQSLISNFDKLMENPDSKRVSKEQCCETSLQICRTFIWYCMGTIEQYNTVGISAEDRLLSLKTNKQIQCKTSLG